MSPMVKAMLKILKTISKTIISFQYNAQPCSTMLKTMEQWKFTIVVIVVIVTPEILRCDLVLVAQKMKQYIQ